MSDSAVFVTLEGVDGAGKSSHVQHVADHLGGGGRHVVVTREPGGTDLAERLREAILEQPMSALTETLLLLAARADHVERVIAPALQAGNAVVCDRFEDATIAYQGAGKGVSLELIASLSEAAHAGLKPKRTLLFDCTYEVASRRLAATGRALDRFEREGREFFERVRKAYLDRAQAEPFRIRVIDAGGDLESVREQVVAALKDL